MAENLDEHTMAVYGGSSGIDAGEPSSQNRVLKRIENTENTVSTKRKHVESQNMEASKSQSGIRQEEGFKSYIPIPKSRLSRELGAMTKKNTRDSGIPRPSDSITGSDFDMQHINRLMCIRDSLSKRPTERSQSADTSLRSRLAKVESLFTEDMNKQVDLEFELDQQLKALKKQAEDLEADLLETKRSHKKLNHRLIDLQMEITSARRAFDLTEESAMKNVSHKEQLINIQIKELSNKLDDQYNEIIFELQNELQTAKSYRDETEIENTKRLMKEIEILGNQLDETKLRKQKTLKGEMDLLDEEMTGATKAKSGELENLYKNFATKESELKELRIKLDNLNELKNRRIEENENINKKLTTIESSMTTFETTRSSLLRQLNILKSEFNETSREELGLDSILNKLMSKIEEIESKKQKHNQQRRILEDSIMNYESKIRVYVKPDSQSVEESLRKLSEDSGHLNRVFPYFASCTDIIDEYTCLVGHVVSGSNVALVLTGREKKDILASSMINCFKVLKERVNLKPNWNFNFSLKCIGIGNSFFDLLSNDNQIRFDNNVQEFGDIDSQSMTINDMLTFTKVVNEISSIAINKALIITVDIASHNSSKRITTTLMHLSISESNLSIQEDMLKSHESNSNNPLSLILRYAFNHTKPLIYSSVDESCLKAGFLNQLLKLGSTDCPYKRD